MSARARPPVNARTRGVKPRSVALGAALTIALVAGIVLLTDQLRHPIAEGQPFGAAQVMDPRAEAECPEPAGSEAEGAAAPSGGPPRPVSAADLRGCPDSFHRVPVSYEGEVVGAVLRRGDGAWLQVNDDAYAGARGPLPNRRDYHGANVPVGVFVTHDVADRIGTIGGPGQRGDYVSVVGEFQRVDADSREVGVIRATSVEVESAGGAIEDVRLPAREVAAGLLAALAVALLAAERLHARRWRRG